MKTDPVDERSERLGARTESVVSPAGLEARVLSSIARADATERAWDSAWIDARRGLALALCVTFASLALALWHEGRLASRIAEVPDAGAELEVRGP
ncbi:MAG TPA: hypothetical protein VL400_07280 [Polyangiaceae bacterium]|nr:hypothetical protein [Polyangiaceae bacterium]